MNEQFHFINAQLWWVAAGIAFLLVLLCVWKEWKGSWDARFITNSLLSVLGVAALLLLYLRPAMLTEVSGKAVVLTDNYKRAQLDSIKEKEKGIRTITYRPGLDFSKSLDAINEVIVLGNGLPSFDFWQLDKVSTTYLKGTVPKGVVKLKYENRVHIGNDMQLGGLYRQPVAGNRLVLETGSGAGLDSIVLSHQEEQVFGLGGTLKAGGRFVYRLTEKDSTGAVLRADPLPMEVLEKQKLRIFIGNRFPSFETKYLKNFLAEEGHQVVVRSQLTKDRYKFEYFNTERRPVYSFREADIKDFDLVILDTDTYLSLSGTNRGTLLGLVKDWGTGLVVQPNESLFRPGNALPGFDWERDAGQKTLTVNEAKVETYPYRFVGTGPSGIPIENHSYAMVVGKGKISTTVLNNTYQLVLDGKTDAYRGIWTSLISRTSKARETSGTFQRSSSFSFVNRPMAFRLRTGVEKPMVSVNGAYTVPLIKNTVLEDTWLGTTYPSGQGWQTLRMEQDTTVAIPYFVMDTIHWNSLRGVAAIRENSRHFPARAGDVVKKTRLVGINAWWFFLIFLSCMGYLWLLPKLKT